MSKKTTKLLGILAAAGAAAGAFCWYMKKHSESDFEEEFNEDFETEDFEIDDDLKDVSGRGYTTLTPSAEETTKSEESEVVTEGCCCENTESTDECCCENKKDITE